MPFMMSAWNVKGVRLFAPAACGSWSATGSVVATGVFGFLALNAAMALFHALRLVMNVAALAL